LIDEHEWLTWLEFDCWLWQISVDDVPLLVLTVVQVPDNDVLVLSISSSFNIEYLSSLTDDVSILVVVPELPPSCVGVPDLQVSSSS
jgi:hypothetical protein